MIHILRSVAKSTNDISLSNLKESQCFLKTDEIIGLKKVFGLCF